MPFALQFSYPFGDTTEFVGGRTRSVGIQLKLVALVAEVFPG
jgi:hypothetical protein